MVAEDGGRYDAWSVVDLDDNEDVADRSVVASPDGRVHVVYDAQRNVLVTWPVRGGIEGRWVRVRGE